MKNLLIIVVILIVIGYLGSKISSKNPAKDNSQPIVATTSIPKEDKVKVSETKLVNKNYSRYITGIATNNSGQQYKYVQVEFNLYDKDGRVVGSTMTNINNLEPGAVWKFEALVFQSEADSFILKGVTAF